MRCILIVTAVLVFFRVSRAADEDLARIALEGEAARTARRLTAADELAAQQKWSEAVDEYYRILTEAGDDLVPLNSRQSLQARRLCHLRLAALPAAPLQLYRNRVDSQAKQWLEHGMANRDPVLLHRLVEESFCSRYTDQALDFLGDLAFERGKFDEAEHWWRMLAMPATTSDAQQRAQRVEILNRDIGGPRSTLRTSDSHAARLIFPDPQVDLGRVRAKQIMARLFRGERAALQKELEAFRAVHSSARGQLAGQEGVYLEILQTLARRQDMLVAKATEEAWSTFGGSAARSLIVPAPPGRWAHLRPLDGPQWTVSLDTMGTASSAEGGSSGKVRAPFEAARFLAFHPVIDGGRVYVADAHRVMGYNLRDGRPILRYDLLKHVKEEPRLALQHMKPEIPAEPDSSYTLSVAGNRIYARLGAQGLGPSGKDAARDFQRAYLVCLKLQFDVTGKVERWPAIASEGTAATGPIFEGAPVVGQGRVFIAESRFAAGQSQTAIVCYGAETGKPLWHTDVCSATQDFKLEGKPRYRHHLITLAGSTLFYCSHTGAIVALDASTGRHVWGIRYPSQVRHTVFGETSPHDLAPCLYAGSRLYVAPNDSDRIFCLEPDTGATVWESGPLQVIQLLGVAKGRLICTTTTPTPCIRALDAATGQDLRYWLHPEDGSALKTFGRGVLAGDWVFWPIRSDRREGLYVLDQETGQAVLFDEKTNGNLAVGDGCLAVAGARELSVYVPKHRFSPQGREEAGHPSSARQKPVGAGGS
jgi:outer membrane protein assembly factor BamB